MIKQFVVNLAKKTLPQGLRMQLRRLNWWRYYKQQTLFSSGSRQVYCPISDREFKNFIRIRGHLVSPTNGARNRQRLVWLYLKNEIKVLEKDLRVLHVAPELSYNTILSKQPNLKYIAGDKMVDGYSNQKGIENIDLTGLPYDESSFDLIICNHVLEHVPDDTAAMAEMYRVLGDNGVAVVTVPINEALDKTYEDFTITSATEREKHFGQWDHIRWYGVDIQKRFEEAGFKVDMNKYGGSFSEEDYVKYGLCDDIIVVARKV